MKIRKSDWAIIREAAANGNLVSMNFISNSKRTELNDRLNLYFRERLPNFSGVYNEDEGEDILYNINNFLKENNIDKNPIDYPISEGTDIHLIPITKSLQLQVIVADEYYGSGDYAKYVKIDSFVINDSTSEKDVDKLIDFTKKYLI